MNEIDYYKSVLECKGGVLYWKDIEKHKRRGLPAGNLNSITKYIIVTINDKPLKAHRIVWMIHNGAIPIGMQIDHIDGNRSNNDISNLRLVTPLQNSYNCGKHKRNKSGYKGIAWHKTSLKWYACIGVNGKTINLGSYDSKEKAAEAYNLAALKHFGQFAKLNIILPSPPTN